MIRTSFEEKYFDYDGLRIRYVDVGEGDPIVFLNGLGGKIEDNDTCFSYLMRDFRVVAFDCPGSGWSDKPARRYNMDYLTEFALDFISRLGIDKFFLAGGSMGGMHTLMCCLKAPDRVRKAVIYSASGVWPANPFLAQALRLLPPQAARPMLHFTSLLWNSPFYPRYLELRREALEYIDSREQPGFGRHVLDMTATQFDRDYRELYRDVITQVLILWGTHDFGMPVAQGRELQTILPRATLIEVPGAGHNVSTEKPEFFADKAREFFKS